LNRLTKNVIDTCFQGSSCVVRGRQAVLSGASATVQQRQKKQVGNICNKTLTKLPDSINDKAKAVFSTKGATMQVEKNSSKKRAANKQNTTSKHKRKK
jgi:hypothetical protein